MTNLDEDENSDFILRVDNTKIRRLPTADGAQGVWFTCPLEDCGHLVCVWFENPLNVEKVLKDVKPYPRWTRTGETLDTLTLNPSIHLIGPGCGWHGWVRNGVAKRVIKWVEESGK